MHWLRNLCTIVLCTVYVLGSRTGKTGFGYPKHWNSYYALSGGLAKIHIFGAGYGPLGRQWTNKMYANTLGTDDQSLKLQNNECEKFVYLPLC